MPSASIPAAALDAAATDAAATAGTAAAADAAGAAGADALATGAGGFAADAGGSSLADAFGSGVGSGLTGEFAADVGGSGAGALAAPIADAVAAGAPAGASGAGGLGSLATWLGTPKTALQTALLANTGLSAVNSLIPKKQVNVGQNAANVMSTNPGFSASLPQYTMQNTATPYSGNWYTYGETPQTPLYNARPIPAKHGGLMGYAHGGPVHGYAMGGQPMMPQSMPPMGAPPQSPQMPPQPTMPKPINPLMLAAAHKVGVAVGKHIRNTSHTPLGRVAGNGGGQDDVVPARLSKDEYVLSADIPAALGDGSSEAGAKKLDQFVKNIRAHKTSNGSNFPPKAKNPLSYLPKGNV